MKILCQTILFSVFFLVCLPSEGQVLSRHTANEIPEKPTRILFLFDASGSMLGPWEGKKKIDLARKVLTKFVDTLRTVPNLTVGLRVYGHQFDRAANNCRDSKLEVAFSPDNHDQVITKINTVTCKGNTPITYSLLQSANDFTSPENYRNIIVIITDGLESCGGNICEVSQALQKKHIFLQPFIIGLGMERDYSKEFSCAGRYFDAKKMSDFMAALRKILAQAVGKTTLRVQLLNNANRPHVTNVNMTFLNSVTQEPVYDFVHYIDASGKPDLLTIDAVPTYDIVVNTIPPITKSGVALEGGKLNTIDIKCPQGSLHVTMPHVTEYKNLKALVRRKDSDKIIYIQDVPETVPYIIGEYDVELLTMPRTLLRGVKIEPDKRTSLRVESPGILNIPETYDGYGYIYKLNDKNQQEFIFLLQNENSRTSMAMQPGKYKLVFRAKVALGSRYTDSQIFEIKSGLTTTLRLYLTK